MSHFKKVFLLALISIGSLSFADPNISCKKLVEGQLDTTQAPFGTREGQLQPGWKLSATQLANLPITQRKQIASIGTSWNPQKINDVSLPLPIAVIKNQAAFSTQNVYTTDLPRSGTNGEPVYKPGPVIGMNVRDLLVRPAGDTLHLPNELIQFEEVIRTAIEFDRSINPNSDKYNIYISTSQGILEAGNYQRRSGAHTDGFQEHDVDYNEQRIIDHTYIVSDREPTEFFNQPFNVGNRSGRESLEFFDATVDESKVVTMQPYTLALMDAFTVHRVAKAKKTGPRTFIKITFSPERFNRVGNTLNPLLEYSGWQWVPRQRDRNSTSANVVNKE